MKNPKDIRRMSLSDFYCTRCGNKSYPIIRRPGQNREPGHLKKLYCLICQEEVNMAEIRSFGSYNLEDFWIEFSNGNFDETGKRKEPWRQFVGRIRQEQERRDNNE